MSLVRRPYGGHYDDNTLGVAAVAKLRGVPQEALLRGGAVRTSASKARGAPSDGGALTEASECHLRGPRAKPRPRENKHEEKEGKHEGSRQAQVQHLAQRLHGGTNCSWAGIVSRALLQEARGVVQKNIMFRNHL